MAGIIYWAVYPSGQADATAQQLIDGTVPSGFHSNDPQLTGGAITGSVITGLASDTSYKLSGVWDDAGVAQSNVDTTTFVTDSVAVPIDVDLQNIINVTITTPTTDVSFTQTVALQNSVDITLTTPVVEIVEGLDTVVTPTTVDVTITTPAVAVEAQEDTNVDLQNSVNIGITTPLVDVLEGIDVSVDLQNSINIGITTPATDVSDFLFVNVELQNSVWVINFTPAVEVVEFVDTNVEPATVNVTITTPAVEVQEGIDLHINLQNVVNIGITTPNTVVDQAIDYLSATEADPLEYEVLVPGVVQLEVIDEVFAWMNEHGIPNTPFPAVWRLDLPNRSTTVGGTVGWAADVLNAGGYAWYIDYDPQIGETGPSFIISPVSLAPGIYEISCVAINPQGNGIRSNIATLTVT